MMNNHRAFLFFLLKFLGIFALLYGGTLLVIGLSASDGYYSPFVAKHLDYVSGLKNIIIQHVGMVVSWWGFNTAVEPGFLIRVVGKRGVIIAMDCVGYGVYSFWIAYILTNSVSWLRKLIWLPVGLLLLWSINIGRISMFLVSINKNRPMPLGIDHHTWFNLVAYGAIFLMMFVVERNNKI